MAMGGAERALLGLLSALDPAIVEVDLFLNQHIGDFMPLIPKKINLLPERKGYNAIEKPMLQVLKEGQYGIVYGRLNARRLHKKYFNSLNDIEKSFDSSIFIMWLNASSPICLHLRIWVSMIWLSVSCNRTTLFLTRLKQRKRLHGSTPITQLFMSMPNWNFLYGLDLTISHQSLPSVPALFCRRSPP